MSTEVSPPKKPGPRSGRPRAIAIAVRIGILRCFIATQNFISASANESRAPVKQATTTSTTTTSTTTVEPTTSTTETSTATTTTSATVSTSGVTGERDETAPAPRRIYGSKSTSSSASASYPNCSPHAAQEQLLSTKGSRVTRPGLKEVATGSPANSTDAHHGIACSRQTAQPSDVTDSQYNESSCDDLPAFPER